MKRLIHVNAVPTNPYINPALNIYMFSAFNFYSTLVNVYKKPLEDIIFVTQASLDFDYRQHKDIQ
jgi:hypothetical protein